MLPACLLSWVCHVRWLVASLLSVVSCLTAYADTTVNDVDAAPTILVMGDSLSAEYGLRRGSGWVALLETRLRDNQFNHSVVNASISGETSAGGRSRLPQLLQEHRPDIVVLELGGNDALRGLPLDLTRQNLLDMVRLAHESGARVLLLGMQIPPNYGRRYAEEFRAIYASIASQEDIALVPFLLEGIGTDTRWFQPDRIHPTEAAQPYLLDNVWQHLAPLLNYGEHRVGRGHAKHQHGKAG